MNTVAEALSLAARTLAQHSESPRLDAESAARQVIGGRARRADRARRTSRIAGEALQAYAQPDRAARARRAGRLFDRHARILVAAAQGHARGARAASGNRNAGRARHCSCLPRIEQRTVLDLGHGQRRDRSRHRDRAARERASPARISRRRRSAWRSDNSRALGAAADRLAPGILVRCRARRALRHDRCQSALRRGGRSRARGARAEPALALRAARRGSRRSRAIIAARRGAS